MLFSVTDFFRRRRKSLILIFSSLVGLLGLFFILVNTDFEALVVFFSNATLGLVFLFIFIQFCLFFVLTLRWAVILKAQGFCNINLFRLNKYRVAGNAVSFCTPTAKIGGDSVKTKLMSEREDIPYSRALSSVMVDNSVDFTTSGLFFFIGALIILFSINVDLVTRFFFGGLILLFVLFLGFFNYRLFRGKSGLFKLATRFGLFKFRFVRSLKKEIRKFDSYYLGFYKNSRKSFFYAVFLSLFSWVLMFFEYYVAGLLLGLNLSVWMIFLIVTLVGIAYLIPIPMALGTLEAGQISAFRLLGINPSAGVGLSFIIRAKDLLLAFWGIGILSFYGFNFTRALEKKGIDEVEEK